MKTIFFAAFALAVLTFVHETSAQSKQTKLNQLELYKQFIGKWQANIGTDSLEIREIREYGMSYVIDVHRVVNGQKIPVYINSISFDGLDGKFKGFFLYPNGRYFTWIGLFTKNNYFSGNIVFNFNPAVVWSEFYAEFINPDEFTCTNFNQEDNKTSVMKFTRIK